MRRPMVLGAMIAAAALAQAGTASAGCMATAGLAQPPPGTAAGEGWTANVRILQHGITPLAGASPTVTIRNAKTGEAKTFAAKSTGETGVYRAAVTFPSGGTWSYEVFDGFPVRECARTHTFAAVSIAGAAGGGSGGWSIATTLLGAAGLALVLGGSTFFLYRRRATPALL